MRVRKSCFVVVVILAVGMGCNLGCTNCPYDSNFHVRYNAERAGRAAIAQFDTDGNGKLNAIELDKCPGLKAAFSRLDPDGLGYITPTAISKRIKQWQASRLGAMPITCTVMHDGKPLEGVQVSFVPEKFLGEYAKIAYGITNSKGLASISISTIGPNAPVGVPPGFYRVEFSKPGVNIPAKYNSETVIGVEVASDVESIEDGFIFDMKY
jgi:hypothetical protein